MGVLILGYYFEGKDLKDIVIVLFDYGGVMCVCKFVDCLKVLIVIIDKCCFRLNEVEVMNIVGNVEGKIVILIDDIIDMVGIIIFVVNVLVENGAVEVYVCCMYFVLLGFVVEWINNFKIKEFVVMNSIKFFEEKKIECFK